MAEAAQDAVACARTAPSAAQPRPVGAGEASQLEAGRFRTGSLENSAISSLQKTHLQPQVPADWRYEEAQGARRAPSPEGNRGSRAIRRHGLRREEVIRDAEVLASGGRGGCPLAPASPAPACTHGPSFGAEKTNPGRKPRGPRWLWGQRLTFQQPTQTRQANHGQRAGTRPITGSGDHGLLTTEGCAFSRGTPGVSLRPERVLASAPEPVTRRSREVTQTCVGSRSW